MDEGGLAQLLLTLTSGNPDYLERAGSTNLPTPSCPSLARVRTAVLREDWTEAEERHKRNCSFCQKAETKGRAVVWHPSLTALFWQARGLADGSDADLAHHLQKDACRRCQRLTAVFQADRLLGRLASQVRQGLAGAATRLGQILASGVVAAFPPLSAASASEQQLAFEGGRCTALLFRTDPPRLRLEERGLTTEAPRLQRLVLGNRREFSERFLVFRSGRETQTRTAEVRLERLPAESATMTLCDVDASALDREDVPLLREGFAAAGKYDPLALPAWQSWAAQALKLPGLDASLRTALQGLVRPDANLPSSPGKKV